jgi:hypothetical protein
VHVFGTDLVVEQGDRVGLQVVDGSGFGTRPVAGATTSRVFPQIGGATQQPESGTPGELLLFADLLPGAHHRPVEALRGAAAASAPEGKVILRKRTKFVNGDPLEVRVVETDGRGWVDALIDDRRIGRLAVPDLDAPVDPAVNMTVAANSGPQAAGIYVTFTHAGSDRLYHHYLIVLRGRLSILD